MASKHHSLNLSEVADVTDLLLAFEEHNKLRLSIELRTVSTVKGPDLVLTGCAWGNQPEDTEAMLLASVSVKCSATNLRALKDALTHLLYALDFRIALNEFDSTKAKEQ